MTALCGGGTSGPKAGIATSIVLGTAALASLLERRGAVWAIALAPLLNTITEDALDLCETDPPADPAFGASDALALLNLGDFGAVTAALGKLATLVKIAMWYEFCECTTGGTPAAPIVPFATPTGYPTAGQQAAVPCWSQSWQGMGEIAAPGGPTAPNSNRQQYLMPNLGLINRAYAPSPEPTIDASILPVPLWSKIVISARMIPPIDPFENVFSTGWFFNAAGAVLATAFGSTMRTAGPYTTNFTVTFDVPAGSHSFAMSVQQVAGSVHGQVAYTLEGWCGGTAPGGSVNPCAADPIVLALLQQIMAMVTLIQRQEVPFGYVTGDVYAALVGTGEVAVAGIVGVLVELTSIPAYLGNVSGTPTRYYEAGWISLGTADGWLRVEPIRHADQLVVSGEAGLYTRIGYTLSPNVEARITELRREP